MCAHDCVPNTFRCIDARAERGGDGFVQVRCFRRSCWILDLSQCTKYQKINRRSFMILCAGTEGAPRHQEGRGHHHILRRHPLADDNQEAQAPQGQEVPLRVPTLQTPHRAGTDQFRFKTARWAYFDTYRVTSVLWDYILWTSILEFRYAT